jgi:hypothetical protein
MVFLDKPHHKQYNDRLDSSIKNDFILKLASSDMIGSFYSLLTSYILSNTPELFDILHSDVIFLLLILIWITSFLIILNNHTISPNNRLAHVNLQISGATLTNYLLLYFNHNFVIYTHIFINAVIVSLVLYTWLNISKVFSLRDYVILATTHLICAMLIIIIFDRTHQIIYCMLVALGYMAIACYNIYIICGRYAESDFYLATITMYMIILDSISSFLTGCFSIFTQDLSNRNRLKKQD